MHKLLYDFASERGLIASINQPSDHTSIAAAGNSTSITTSEP